MLEASAQVNPRFWEGKRVFLTGHTGFKGSWLALWLHQMGAEVKGFALDSPSKPALFEVAKIENYLHSEKGDIRNLEQLSRSLKDFNPDIVLHLAAQSLVFHSYAHPLESYTTNVIGTANLLEACRPMPRLKAIVAITTDKVYENREWVWAYRENEALGGKDPYSSSKACSELVIASFQHSFFQNPAGPQVAAARAGNVVGGGDWAEDGLIPDILRAFEQSKPVLIRNPLAVRPWQHVLEPLSGYLLLAEALYEKGAAFAGAWNFGPADEDCKSVQWILDQMVKLWGEGASWELDQQARPHEARLLKLDSSKAAVYLGWKARWRLEAILPRIIEWHWAWRAGENMALHCLNDIAAYAATSSQLLSS